MVEILRARSARARNDVRSWLGIHGRYHFDRLVYFETYDYIVDAITREKRIKGLTRAKKIALVKTMNPTWRDLSPDLTSP